MKKGIAPIIIIIIATIIIGGSVFYYQRKKANVIQNFQKPLATKEIAMSTTTTGGEATPPSNEFQYKGTNYLIIKTIERRDPVMHKAVLATTDIWPACSSYVGKKCAIFLVTKGDIKHLADVNEMDEESLFIWSQTNNDEIIYGRGFGEGGHSFEAIESLNIETGTIKDIIVRSSVSDIDFVPADTILRGEKDCGRDIFDYTEVRRGNDRLEFANCWNEFSEFFYYLVFNNKVLQKIPGKNITVKKDFELDIKENMNNSSQFSFTFLDMKYILETETGTLKINQ